jgi:hypothetical protein
VASLIAMRSIAEVSNDVPEGCPLDGECGLELEHILFDERLLDWLLEPLKFRGEAKVNKEAQSQCVYAYTAVDVAIFALARWFFLQLLTNDLTTNLPSLLGPSVMRRAVRSAFSGFWPI